MINLLPPQTKRHIRAARQNIVLRRYCFLVVFSALLFSAIFAVGFWVTSDEKSQAERAKAADQQAMAQYADVREQAEQFASDLKTAKEILGGSVSFSDLIIDIAATVPPGVVLNNLALGATTQKGPIDITGRAKSYDAVLAIKTSLESSDIFQDVNIASTTQGDSEGDYQFTFNIKAQFSGDNK